MFTLVRIYWKSEGRAGKTHREIPVFGTYDEISAIAIDLRETKGWDVQIWQA